MTDLFAPGSLQKTQRSPRVEIVVSGCDRGGRDLHAVVLLVRCQHPGCDAYVTHGQSGSHRAYLAAVARREPRPERLIGRWMCKEHAG